MQAKIRPKNAPMPAATRVAISEIPVFAKIKIAGIPSATTPAAIEVTKM